MSTNFQNDADLEGYIPVAERVELFYADHKDGRLISSVIEHNAKRGFILMKCEAYRNLADTLPASTGHAQEYRDDGDVNRTSYIENCETSAWGRALAGMGYGVKRGIASREEMLKVQRHNDAPRRDEYEHDQRQSSRPLAPACEWQAKNGKAILVLKDNEREPNEVPCPIHPGKTFKRRENNNGSWLSHKDGQDNDGRVIYCSASFGRAPRPQASAGDLKAVLAAHNSNNGHRAN